MHGQTFLSAQLHVALVNNLVNDFFSAQGSLSKIWIVFPSVILKMQGHSN